MEKLLIKRLNDKAVLPKRATGGSAGADLCACIDFPVTIEPGELSCIPTGISIKLPGNNFAAMVYARSGLAVNHGIGLSNGVGVIDSDYTGEIKVGLINQGKEPYTITPGERIAQLIIHPVLVPDIEEVDIIPETERGGGGFGSTGKV